MNHLDQYKRHFQPDFIFKYLIFGIFLLLYFSCSKEKVNDQTIVAKVGSRPLTVRDFRISYELAPPGEKRSTTDILARKKAYLQKMLEEKLLATAALERGLDKDSTLQPLLKWSEKQAVIRALYRQAVHDQVKVSEDDIRAAYILYNQRLFLRQILVQTAAEANEIYRRIQAGESFEKIAMERATSEQELQHFLTANEFRWGELEERLETAAYGLNHGEVSAPVQSGVGYHLLQLVDRRENLILTETGYADRHHYIETIIRRRKEAALAKAYLKNLMVPKRLKANGPVLRELTRRAQAILREKYREKPVPPYAQARIIRPHLQDLLDKNLLIFDGGAWTVGDVLAQVKKMPPQARPDLTNPGALKVKLALMFRDDFLAKEAYQRDLQDDPEVQTEMRQIREDVVAEKLRRALLDSVTVSEREIRRFYDENIKRYQTPEMVNIREIMVRDRKLADSLYTVVRNGGDIAALAKKFSVRKWAAKNGGDLGFFSRDAFGNLGKKAFELQVGQLSRPLPVKIDTFTVGYSIFRVIARKPLVTPALGDVYDRVSREALSQKKVRVLTHFLDQVKEKHPVTLNEKALAETQTTDELGNGRAIDLVHVSRR